MREQALSYLESNPLSHIDMIVVIKRGSAKILYAGRDGVLLREKDAGAYMMSVTDPEIGLALLSRLDSGDLFCLHQEYLCGPAQDRFGPLDTLTCYQAVYTGREPPVIQSGLEIRRLDVSYLDILYRHYNRHADAGYLEQRLSCGAMYGGFIDGRLCGFVGTHDEGSMGILHILDECRGQGFGAALECFMIHRILEEGGVPFAQVSVDNAVSLRLQQRLGLTVSTDRLFWLYQSN